MYHQRFPEAIARFHAAVEQDPDAPAALAKEDPKTPLPTNYLLDREGRIVFKPHIYDVPTGPGAGRAAAASALPASRRAVVARGFKPR